MADALLHDCPGQCGKQIARNMLSCQDCRLDLPGPLRAELEVAYPKRRTNPVAYHEATTGCLAWYRANRPVRES